MVTEKMNRDAAIGLYCRLNEIDCDQEKVEQTDHFERWYATVKADLLTDAEPVEPFGWTSKHVNDGEQHRLWGRNKCNVLDYPGQVVQALYAAPPAPSVAVNALEWNDDPCPAAECVFGHYVINLHYCHVELLFNYGSIMSTSIARLQLERGATVDDIKATAQADYNERIRSALSALPVDDALPDVGKWTDDDRARAWRKSFDTMHRRAMKAEAALSAQVQDVP